MHKKMKKFSPQCFILKEPTHPGVNVLEGLRLYNDAINTDFEQDLIDFMEHNVQRGLRGELPGETFSCGAKTIKGNGRHVLQYGAKFSFIKKNIDVDVLVEPIPQIVHTLIDQLTAQGMLPEDKRPDTVIVNVYNEGDCIPPHIDALVYPRPFCTVSMLTPAPMLLGCHIKALGDGRFKAPFKATLQRRSVLVFEGNGADLAKHCVPPVTEKRISITLRRMPDFARPIIARHDPTVWISAPQQAPKGWSLDQVNPRIAEESEEDEQDDEAVAGQACSQPASLPKAQLKEKRTKSKKKKKNLDKKSGNAVRPDAIKKKKAKPSVSKTKGTKMASSTDANLQWAQQFM